MADFIAWRFLIFATLFAAMVYVHFYLAHRQWKRIKGEQATEIDVNYVRSETYLPQSFRMKVKTWSTLPSTEEKDGGTVIQKGPEKIRLIEKLELPGDSSCDDILVLKRDFLCGPASRLSRELLVHGNCEIGSDSRAQALAVDGDLVLGERVQIARWVDSTGELRVGNGTQIGSRATSQRRIWLGLNSEVLSAHAPEVVTTGWGAIPEAGHPPALIPMEIVFPEDPKAPAKTVLAARMKPEQFLQLGADTWLYKGDVMPPVPVRITKKLAVSGDCYFPAGSILEGDVKASGSIFLGPSCIVKGNLVAEGHILLGAGCRFSGLIHAERTVLISGRTRGSREDGMVAVYAGERLSVEGDVAVKGKLASGGRVAVVDAMVSSDWKVERGVREDVLRLERV